MVSRGGRGRLDFGREPRGRRLLTMTKICVGCGLELDSSNFYLHRGRPRGNCRPCRAKAARANRYRRTGVESKPRPVLTEATKVCLGCGVDKPRAEFYLYHDKAVGQCLVCRNLRARNSSRARGTKEFSPQVVTDTHKRCSKCKELRPLEEFSNNAKRVGGKGSYCQPCRKLHAIATPEYRRKYYLSWRAANPELARAKRQLRCDRVKDADDGTVTPEFLVELYSQDSCYYCQERVPISSRTADHVVPVSRGGKHSHNNLVMACGSCNSSKGTMDADRFLAYKRSERNTLDGVDEG